jgi:hypothetical protein
MSYMSYSLKTYKKIANHCVDSCYMEVAFAWHSNANIRMQELQEKLYTSMHAELIL